MIDRILDTILRPFSRRLRHRYQRQCRRCGRWFTPPKPGERMCMWCAIKVANRRQNGVGS